MAYFNPDDAPDEVLNSDNKKHVTARFRNEADMKEFFDMIGAGKVDTRTKVVKYVPKAKRTSLSFLF